MNRSILTLIITAISLSLLACIKTKPFSNTNFQALAKFISFEGGDKVHLAKFQIIKSFSDSLLPYDTILVAYHGNKLEEIKLEYALLTLTRDKENPSLKNYFTCPEYNHKLGIAKAKVDFIDFEYWEACETGVDCRPLTFTRPPTNKYWFLIMPCGGTQTDITISGSVFDKEIHLPVNNCPPHLDLSDLDNGQYTANMIACGLGGSVIFNLKSDKE
jgi:hypothetical protein